VPQAPSAVADSEHVEGVARRVRIDNEGGGCVLRFVVHTDDGRQVPVEMRNRVVLGVLDNGDRVTFDRAAGTGTARPRQIVNLSTNAAVEVPASGRLERWSGLVGLRDVRTAVIPALVTAGVGYFTNAFKSGNEEAEPARPGPNQREPAESTSSWWWLLLVAGTLVVVAALFLVMRRGPFGRQVAVRRVLAVVAGVALGIAALALAR
jgi:hypothetical protein